MRHCAGVGGGGWCSLGSIPGDEDSSDRHDEQLCCDRSAVRAGSVELRAEREGCRESESKSKLETRKKTAKQSLAERGQGQRPLSQRAAPRLRRDCSLGCRCDVAVNSSLQSLAQRCAVLVVVVVAAPPSIKVKIPPSRCSGAMNLIGSSQARGKGKRGPPPLGWLEGRNSQHRELQDNLGRERAYSHPLTSFEYLFEKMMMRHNVFESRLRRGNHCLDLTEGTGQSACLVWSGSKRPNQPWTPNSSSPLQPITEQRCALCT